MPAFYWTCFVRSPPHFGCYFRRWLLHCFFHPPIHVSMPLLPMRGCARYFGRLTRPFFNVKSPTIYRGPTSVDRRARSTLARASASLARSLELRSPDARRPRGEYALAWPGLTSTLGETQWRSRLRGVGCRVHQLSLSRSFRESTRPAIAFRRLSLAASLARARTHYTERTRHTLHPRSISSTHYRQPCRARAKLARAARLAKNFTLLVDDRRKNESALSCTLSLSFFYEHHSALPFAQG